MQGLLGQEDRLTALLDDRRQSRQSRQDGHYYDGWKRRVRCN
jgi:hypothetical protein